MCTPAMTGESPHTRMINQANRPQRSAELSPRGLGRAARHRPRQHSLHRYLALMRTTSKARGQQIKLSRIGTTGWGLYMLDGREVALERRKKRAFGAALAHLGGKCPARRERLAGEFEGRFNQRHNPQMI